MSRAARIVRHRCRAARPPWAPGPSPPWLRCCSRERRLATSARSRSTSAPPWSLAAGASGTAVTAPCPNVSHGQTSPADCDRSSPTSGEAWRHPVGLGYQIHGARAGASAGRLPRVKAAVGAGRCRGQPCGCDVPDDHPAPCAHCPWPMLGAWPRPSRRRDRQIFTGPVDCAGCESSAGRSSSRVCACQLHYALRGFIPWG